MKRRSFLKLLGITPAVCIGVNLNNNKHPMILKHNYIPIEQITKLTIKKSPVSNETLHVKTNGTIVIAGNNSYGQLGVET